MTKNPESPLQLNPKQRACLISLAAKEPAVLYIGKNGVTPELTDNLDEALTARELVKASVQQNCLYDIRETASVLAERTRSVIVPVIGRKIVFYRRTPKLKNSIQLPR